MQLITFGSDVLDGRGSHVHDQGIDDLQAREK